MSLLLKGFIVCLLLVVVSASASAEIAVSIRGGSASIVCSTDDVNQYALDSGIIGVKPQLKNITSCGSAGMSVDIMFSRLGAAIQWDRTDISETWSQKSESVTINVGGDMLAFGGIIEPLSYGKVDINVQAGGYTFWPYKKLTGDWSENLKVSRSLGAYCELKTSYRFDGDYSAAVAAGYRLPLRPNIGQVIEKGIYGYAGLAVHF